MLCHGWCLDVTLCFFCLLISSLSLVTIDFLKIEFYLVFTIDLHFFVLIGVWICIMIDYWKIEIYLLLNQWLKCLSFLMIFFLYFIFYVYFFYLSFFPF